MFPRLPVFPDNDDIGILKTVAVAARYVIRVDPGQQTIKFVAVEQADLEAVHCSGDATGIAFRSVARVSALKRAQVPADGCHVGFQLGDVGFQLGDVGFQLSDVGFQLGDVGFQLSDVGFQL